MPTITPKLYSPPLAHHKSIKRGTRGIREQAKGRVQNTGQTGNKQKGLNARKAQQTI